MLKISREADYATRMLVDLAEQPHGARPTTLDIAERQAVPRSLAPRVIQRLAKASLVHSRPGRSGGLTLARSAEAINMRHIVEAFHGPIALNQCAQGPGACPRDVVCPAHDLWMRIQESVVGHLEGTTLADLVARARLIRQERGLQLHSPSDPRRRTQ